MTTNGSRHARPARRRGLARGVRMLAMVLLAVLTGGAAADFPTPSSVPYRWELDFRPGDLRIHVDPAEGAIYWYFTYMVVNRTDDDQIWAPSFVLYTDDGEIMVSGRDVPTRVEETIRDRLGNELLELQNEILGDLYQGEEHAREGLVVWPARDVKVNEITLFIGGLSGETARVRNPVTGKVLILRKTLQRDYLVRGDVLPRRAEPIELDSQRWVMR